MEAAGLISALAVPLILALAGVSGALRGRDVYGALAAGARQGLRTTAEIVPPLTALLAAVYLLRASGAMEGLVALLTPLLAAVGIPPETAPILLLRPLSGSGALAAASELMAKTGPDSLTGYTASVMLGSTETTFYVISVYFAAAGVRRTRYAIPAALCADAAGFLVSAWISRQFWG